MTEEIKSVKDETIDEESLPELVQWSKIGGRPTSLRDLSISDADKLDDAPKTDDLGHLAWEDVADEIHIATNAITETKISDNSISTPKLQTGSVTSAKVTTGELITLSAQIRDAIINTAHIDYLSADDITTGTLIGRTIQTASSGNYRVAMLGNTDTIEWITDGNLISTEMYQYQWSQGQGFKINCWNDAFLTLASGSPQSFVEMEVGSNSFTVGGSGISANGEIDHYGDFFTDYMRSYGDMRVDNDLTIYGTTNTKNLGVTDFIILSGIPTSDPGNAGVVYRDGNDLRISTG